MPVTTHTHVEALNGRRLRTAAAVMAVAAAFALAAVLAIALSGGASPTASPPQQAVPGETSRVAPGVRYDGGPEEGSRGFGDLVAPNPGRPDGGPEEGTRGPGH